MLKLIFFVLGISATFSVCAQSHDEEISKIKTVEEARLYAAQFKEVSVDIVNYERDVFLFDNVDLENLAASVGKVKTLYRRRTRFLKDTLITMVNLQTISFNSELVGLETASSVVDSILADYENGFSYWDLMKKYRSATCFFESGPMPTDAIKARYGSTMEERKRKEAFESSFSNQPNFPIVVIIHQEGHKVPAFYAISYTISG